MAKQTPTDEHRRKHPAQQQVGGDKDFISRPDEEDEVDVASEDSFPASDPPSNTPVTHPGDHGKKQPQ